MADAHGGLTATVSSKPTVKLLSTPSNASPLNASTNMTAISQPNEENISSTTTKSATAAEPSASSTLKTKSAPGSDDTTHAKAAESSSAHDKHDKGTESESDGDDAEEILEESPCKRWSKRREKVKQRDVPGIDFAFLAMDNETGNEVVWNEVQFSERKNFRAQEEKINAVFDNLTQLIHPNLVKFHKYWTDAKSEKPRIIFITEYMSSGSMSRFLTRTRKSNSSMSIKAWKKWCTQILSALNYLHSCDPPIVHGNLSCTTIFIQTNGLIKIGCVAPNAIHHHVKTFRENMKNMHYIAPEYELCTAVTPAADIYSFGICALEMAVAGGFGTNGDGSAPVVTPDLIKKSIESLEDPLQRNLIEICLAKDPESRPTARELLFHRILFEVHSLKLLAAHALVSSEIYEALSEDKIRLKDVDMDKVVAEIRGADGKPRVQLCYNEIQTLQTDIDKFLEDVSNGIYPLTAYVPTVRPPVQRLPGVSAGPGAASSTSSVSGADVDRSRSPADATACSASTSSVGQPTVMSQSATEAEPEPEKIIESRKIVRMSAELKPTDNGGAAFVLTLLLKLEDMMNRQLTAEISESDDADMLVHELVLYGFVKEDDYAELTNMVRETLQAALLKSASESSTPSDCSTPRLDSGSKAPLPVPEPQS